MGWPGQMSDRLAIMFEVAMTVESTKHDLFVTDEVHEHVKPCWDKTMTLITAWFIDMRSIELQKEHQRRSQTYK